MRDRGQTVVRAAAAGVCLTLALAASAAAQTAIRQPEPLAPALKEFQQRLQAYLALRAELGKKLAPLSITPSAPELAARQTALATALRTARAGATQGNLIPPAVQAEIARRVQADFRRRSEETEDAALQEVPKRPRPVINRVYPPDEALATVPPLLLGELPQLPDNLQYRFYGRHVVILDGDVQIIIDYVPDALPPH